MLVDTNLLISAMLSVASPPARVLDLGMASHFDLLISAGSIEELFEKCAQKPYLAQRIPASALTRFVDLLSVSATILPNPELPPEAVTRDPRDDYLIAHAVAEQIDTLVSGDRDLLALDGAFPFRILAPAAFVAALEADDDTR
ncbi:MAG: putative toxin-antitoxin system toxin component, PIN family [Thermomicrobiales bacterium]